MPSFVPTKSHDVFVSYASIDDQPTFPEIERGWVSYLIKHLRKLIAVEAGGEGLVDIWADERLLEMENLTTEILQEVRNSAIFFAVLSPGFAKSNWCRKEADEFMAFQSEVQKRMGDGLPVIIVEKKPPRSDVLPDALYDRHKRRFWIKDDDRGARASTLADPAYRDKVPPHHEKFYQEVCSLAETIYRILEKLRKEYEVPEVTGDTGQNAELEPASAESSTSAQGCVVVNSSPIEHDKNIASDVRERLERTHTNCLHIGHSDSIGAFREIYRTCRAVALVATDSSKEWLDAQFKHITKAGADRETPFDFLLIVTKFAGEPPAWVDELDEPSFRFVKESTIKRFEDI